MTPTAEGATATPSLRLVCLCGDEPGPVFDAWARQLAPEVETLALPVGTAGADTLPGALDRVLTTTAPTDRPFALLASGALASTAVELARRCARGRSPVHLIVGACPPPPPGDPLDCPVVAFAPPDSDGGHDATALWRSVTTDSFVLRLLPVGQATLPCDSADVALAVKEELRIWPY